IPDVAMRNALPSISDEVTAERTLETISVRNAKPARVSMPDIIMEDDTVTNERPLTKAEMERVAAIAAQLGRRSSSRDPAVREEKSALTLDIDFSEFDSL
ncbi:MAG TPA: hypothetical protein PK156_37440, partial [Polyangium sp.]|nr:hypothetical protein [Polyangium sp.]